MANALILKAQGTNCEGETAFALRYVGGTADIVYVNRFLEDPSMLGNYDLLIGPGGFSYGDDIAAGRIFANELSGPGERMKQFLGEGGIAIGVCNWCQVLAEAGYVPGFDGYERMVAFTDNDVGHFREIDVTIRSRESRCLFVPEGMEMTLPIAHGEGKFQPMNDEILERMKQDGYVVFEFVGDNPNGSVEGITGITNTEGNVLAMMPHPERRVVSYDPEKEHGDGYYFWKHVVDWIDGKR